MGLDWGDLLPDFKASLNDAAQMFTAADDADFKRHLRIAAAVLGREKRPRTLLESFTLIADQALYDEVPTDLQLVKTPVWPTSQVAPWDAPNDPLPSLFVVGEGDTRQFLLRPAPTCRQISCFGSTYQYYYLAAHAITDDAATSTLQEKDRALLYLRAQAEALRELAFRNFVKPVTLRGGAGIGGSMQTRNQTPAALHDLLMAEFRETP